MGKKKDKDIFQVSQESGQAPVPHDGSSVSKCLQRGKISGKGDNYSSYVINMALGESDLLWGCSLARWLAGQTGLTLEK